MKYFKKTCHGCAGKGWVETRAGNVKKCPVCNGSGKIPSETPDIGDPVIW